MRTRTEKPKQRCRAHHWLVETPNGTSTSRGICRRCGEVRQFPNAYADIAPDAHRRLRGNEDGALALAS